MKSLSKCQEMTTIRLPLDYYVVILLDYLHHKKYYKHIGINLSRQKDTNISQQISFVGKLRDDSVTMFFIAEKQQKIILF